MRQTFARARDPHALTARARYELPWTFSTFDYRELCELLDEQNDGEFETAKVNGRTRRRRPHRPRRPVRAADRRRARLAADAARRRLPAARRPALARARGAPARRVGDDLEIWIDRRYVPAGYGWSFPARDELRIGVGSFDPRFHVKDTTVELAEDLGSRAGALPGQLDPAQAARRATEDGVFFAGDSAGPLPAAHRRGHPHRALLRHRLRPRAARVVEGRRRASRRCARYHAFTAAHEWKFGWMLRAQRLVPQVPPRAAAAGARRDAATAFVDWSFAHYLRIAPPEFAPPSPAVARACRSGRAAPTPCSTKARGNPPGARLPRSRRRGREARSAEKPTLRTGRTRGRRHDPAGLA